MRSFTSTLGQLRVHHYYSLFTCLFQVFSVAPLKGLLENVYFRAEATSAPTCRNFLPGCAGAWAAPDVL